MDLKKEKKFGIEKGEQKKEIQIVRAMLKEKIDIDIISKVTGLTKEEIQNIDKNN